MSTGRRGYAPCCHCHRFRYLRPRQLCSRCYNNLDIKALHPPTDPRFGVCTGNPSGGLPTTPTTAHPGSDEKMAVMSERIAAGLSPFHPWDARYEGDERPFVWFLGRLTG